MKLSAPSLLPLALGSLLVGSVSSPAALLFYEGFAAGDYTAGEINGQAQSLPGYAGGTWNSTSDFVDGGLTYPGLPSTPGFSLFRDNGEVQAALDVSPGGVFGTAGLVGSNAKIGGTGVDSPIYFSVLARKEESANGFAGFQVYNDGQEGFGVGQVTGGNADSLKWLQQGGNAPIGEDPIPWTAGQTELFVFKMDFDPTDPTSATVWVNPDITLAEGAQDSAISSFIPNAVPDEGFNTLRMRGNQTWSFDEIRIGTTWESVTPIPEPGSTLLSFAAVLGFALKRNRSRR